MTRASPLDRLRPLLIAAVAVVALPFVLRALGLSLNTGTWVIGLAIATMGLNLCIGYTGLVSFGHSTWFGIGAYAAGLIQLRFLPGEIWLPLLLSMAVVAIASTVIGMLILRRRGVYFSLLTLALAALVYTTAFRWTSLTGGEDGLGGLKRGHLGPVSLDSALGFTRWSRLSGLWCFMCTYALCARLSAMCWWRSARTSCARAFRAIRSSATSSLYS
jgi:branched-chain amino acid transport system ATP-binding protein